MRRPIAAAVVGFVATTVLASSIGVASAATSTNTSPCTAIDAPKAMNDLPASADCNLPTSGLGGIHANALSPLANPVTPTTAIATTPLAFDRTNGDILAITKVSGTNDLAFGGNFTLVYTPDGVSHPAVNFAVVDETSGAIIYAGNPSNSVTPSDNYVRAITSLNGVIYVGGDFDGWDGVARFHAAMLSPTGNPAPAAWAVTANWNPSPSGFIRGLAVDGSAVYMGGDSGFVTAVNPTTGATIWSQAVTGGAVHAILEDQGALFVGGLFETYNGYAQHGLVKVALADGSVITAFNANLRADTGVGQYGEYDGEDIISLALASSSSQILAGSGGHAPAGLSSNEALLFNITTGARAWRYGTIGDSQAIGTVGDTVVSGYHNNSGTAGNPLSANYFGIQLEASNGAPTTWDPQINGDQSNADGGNNGVQGMYVDPVNDILFLAGAFEHWNGITGLTHSSLIAFSFIPSTATAPGAPTGVSATAANGNATVSWTAPVSSGGSPITGYTVTSAPGGVMATTTGATSVLVPGLTNGTTYTFTVTATNAVGTGAASTPSAAVTPVSGGGLSNSAEGGTVGSSVTTSNSGGGSGSAFTIVNKGAGAALIYSAAGAAHGSLGYALTGSSGTGTDVGWSGFNATAMAVRFYYNPGSTLPSAALRLADVRNASGTAARVMLSASNQLFIQNTAGTTLATFAHTLQASTWYRIELTISVSASAATINAAYYPADSTTPVDPAYASSTGNTGTANITQVLIGSAASATWTGTGFFDDLAAQPGSVAFIGPYVAPGSTAPGAPTGVSAVPADGQASVSWTAPASNGGTAITGYTVTSSPGGFTASTAGTTSASVTGLTDGTSYTFTVTATNSIGTGSPSAASSPVTPATVPGAPTAVGAVPGDGQASVSWTAPASNGGSAITGYTVTSSPGGLTGTTAGPTSATVNGLTDGTPYTFTVTATNSVGTGAASAASSPVTPVPAPTAPGAPTAVTATPGNGQATVTWTAPTSNGGSAITGYAVTSSPGGFTANTAGTTSVAVTNLTNGTPYTFTVTAANSVGTGPASVASSPVTPVSGIAVSNSAEGGTAGTSVTAANSGGASGNAFTVFSKGTGAALVYSTAAHAHGVLGYSLTGASGTATSMGWNGYSATSMAVRFYYNPGPTLPSAVLRLADIRNASGTAARVELSATNQIFIQNNAGTTVTTFPHALQANTWYRIELAISISSSAATINAAYYLLDATTPVDPALASTTGNTGAANITQVTVGSTASATWTGTSYFDDLASQSPSTAFIGPVTASPTAPGAPTAVGAVPGDGQATVSWTAPASNGGSAITGYTVTSSPGALTASTAGTTSTTVLGLTNGIAYTFTVKATNSVGPSAASAASNSVTPVAAVTVPGAPTGATATAGDSSASVSWTAPASNGGSPITGYTVTSAPGGFTTTSAGTSATVNGLTNGTSYTFTVVATNSVGPSAASTASNSVTPVAAVTVPGAPTGATATAGDSSATVSWTAPASNGGSAITGYTVTAAPGGAFATTLGATSATVTGLTNGTSYTFTVTATNSVGPSAPSADSNSVTPAAATVPDAPTGATATAGDSSASVSWTAPASSGGSPITGYTVTAAPGGAFATTLGATSATVSGLTNGTAYTFTVVATNSVGPGSASDPSNQVTPAAVVTAPGAPTSITATGGDGSASVSWTAPASNGGSAITGYTVTAAPGGAFATTLGATSATVTGLTNGATYTFTVTASNSVGPGSASSASNPVTPAAAVTPPGAPTAVIATAGNGSATVSWTAPLSNGGSAITGYTVTSSPGGLTASTGGTTSTTVLGLTNGVAYTFTVKAANTAGPGSASAPSNAVTPAAPAGALSNTAEGGTAGTSVTAANSGGGSGNAFTVVSKGAGAALVYSTSAVHGSRGYALTGASGTATLMGWNALSATSMAVRFYYNPGSSLPSSVLRLADIRNASGTAARVELSAANQLFIQNAAGTTVTTFAHALQANTWYRIELTISVSASGATINAAYYLGDSTTPVDPAYATSTGNTGTANLTQVSIGSAASATWTGTSFFDDVAIQSGSTTFIGPSSP